jgi:cytochrome b
VDGSPLALIDDLSEGFSAAPDPAGAELCSFIHNEHSMSGGYAGSIETRPRVVKVWDLFVRWFHWLLVVSFALAWYSGGIWDNPHLAAGYAVAALVVAFVGTRHARFTDFVYSPQSIIRYLFSMVRMRAPRYLGHNPAGGAMVIMLLATMAVLCTTGILMTTDAFWGVQWVNDLHNDATNFALILIGLHVAGVIISSIEHRDLVLAMITGWKRAP